MIAWLLAFLATCAVELAIMQWLGPEADGSRRVRKREPSLGRGSPLWGPPHPRRLRVALLAQVGTHPFVWIAMAALPGSQLARLACVELWATLVEAAVYKRFLGMRGRDAFALSAFANAASLLAVSAAALLL